MRIWLGLALVLLSAGIARAHEYTVKALTIGHPWSLATHGPARTGVVYVTLINDGKIADRLLGATSPLADRITIHEEIKDGAIMRMRETKAVEIPAGQTVELKPGALHMMLEGLHRPLKDGEMFPLTLKLANEGDIPVEVMVSDQ